MWRVLIKRDKIFRIFFFKLNIIEFRPKPQIREDKWLWQRSRSWLYHSPCRDGILQDQEYYTQQSHISHSSSHITFKYLVKIKKAWSYICYCFSLYINLTSLTWLTFRFRFRVYLQQRRVFQSGNSIEVHLITETYIQRGYKSSLAEQTPPCVASICVRSGKKRCYEERLL